jgi:hypothetical protein
MIPPAIMQLLTEYGHHIPHLVGKLYEGIESLLQDPPWKQAIEIPAPKSGVAPTVREEQQTPYVELNQFLKQAVASGQSVDALLGWLRERAPSQPESIINCPRCGTSRPISNVLQIGFSYNCQKCGAKLLASRCPACSRWRSTVKSSSKRLCKECQAEARRFVRQERSPTLSVPTSWQLIAPDFEADAEAYRLIRRLEELLSKLPNLK